MSTKQKRKYGGIKKGAETTQGTNQSVFDKFLPPVESKPQPRPETSIALPSSPSHGVTPRNPTQPTAPSRDFNKRANSLDRLALPAGIFPGSSKKLYDALYIRTRGAITPARTIRATKRELSEWSGIRNVKTIDSHMRYFCAVGLVISEWQRGQNDGCLYEVLLPEETSGLFVGRTRGVIPPDTTLPHVTPPDTTSDQNLGLPSPQNLGLPHLTNAPDLSTTYSDAKTDLKTKDQNIDDEAFADFLSEFKTVVKELTGKEPTAADRSKYRELAQVLLAELKIAAGRTTISSVPAFMAEHLRRRLWKMDKKQAAREGKELPDQVAPAEQKNPVDCPDCNGSGWWYPNGTEKGVAKCKHTGLNVPSPLAE